MNKLLSIISIGLLLSAFQAAPVLAGEANSATQTYSHSSAHNWGTRDTPQSPYGFSPAPPSRHPEKTGNRAAVTANPGTSSWGKPGSARLAATKNSLLPPYGFSPAPPSRQERRLVTGNERIPGYAIAPPMPPRGNYRNATASENTGEAPLGFFPQQRACPSTRC